MSAGRRFERAVPGDRDAIVEMQLKMAHETENLTLDRTTVTKGVQALFDNPERGFYFVCRDGDATRGCLLIIPEWSDWRNRAVWWIHSLYLEPTLRGQGVFSELYAFIKSMVERDTGLGGLRLYVDRKNTHAQSVYAKLGMSREHYEMFEWLK